MTSHLKSGCDSCAKEKAIWSKLASFAKTEPEFEPPDHVVNAAKALMQAPKRETAAHRIREIAELVFDSFLTPQLAGVRSAAGVGSRQLLYRAGEVMIDVRFEASEESERFALDRPGLSGSRVESRDDASANIADQREERTRPHFDEPVW